MAYSSVNQLGYEIAQSIAALLPDHPRLHGTQSLAQIGLVGPKQRVTLPRDGGGSVRLGPGSGPHLVLFFDTWETEVTTSGSVSSALTATRPWAGPGLPPVVAIDEAGRAVARGAAALPAGLPQPLAYPVAIDRSGTVADGYRVAGLALAQLVSGYGRVLFYEDLASRAGRPPQQLLHKVQAALARAKR